MWVVPQWVWAQQRLLAPKEPILTSCLCADALSLGAAAEERPKVGKRAQLAMQASATKLIQYANPRAMSAEGRERHERLLWTKGGHASNSLFSWSAGKLHPYT